MDSFARRLKLARIRNDFHSCRAFAIAKGFCPRTYQRHESGDRKINIPTLSKYCQALNISIMWIYTGDEKYLNQSYELSNM